MNVTHQLRLAFSMIALFACASVQASGMAYGSDDIVASLVVVGLLVIILGLIYLFNFINRIFKDPDYRDGIKNKAISIFSIIADKLGNKNQEYRHIKKLFGNTDPFPANC